MLPTSLVTLLLCGQNIYQRSRHQQGDVPRWREDHTLHENAEDYMRTLGWTLRSIELISILIGVKVWTTLQRL